ncbi:MAG: hypothetical protein CO066_05555 [Comamonadaceae bacterium CG_4_9_14_0_8_um_filter_60_18]|nr:MAG: hypothetical protein CO066_05555 [Comamonadaceae bacterium CG_4_9_14_0_8_um_filter_60_18]
MSKVNWCDRTMLLGPYYCLVTTHEQFKQELKRLGIAKRDWPDYRPQQDATCYPLENQDGKSAFIVAIRNWQGRNPVEVAGLLVHEATHVMQHTMRIIGENEPSSEFEAYMMQNISANLMQAFVEQTL